MAHERDHHSIDDEPKSKRRHQLIGMGEWLLIALLMVGFVYGVGHTLSTLGTI
jgi:hypothetical protein